MRSLHFACTSFFGQVTFQFESERIYAKLKLMFFVRYWPCTVAEVHRICVARGCEWSLVAEFSKPSWGKDNLDFILDEFKISSDRK